MTLRKLTGIIFINVFAGIVFIFCIWFLDGMLRPTENWDFTDYVEFSYYDPTHPDQWSAQALMVKLSFPTAETRKRWLFTERRSLYKTLEEGVFAEIRKIEERGLFRWPITLYNKRKVYSLNDLEQVREK